MSKNAGHVGLLFPEMQALASSMPRAKRRPKSKAKPLLEASMPPAALQVPGINASPGMLSARGLHPEQLAVVVAEGPAILVDAGAGTGKSHVLAERAVHVVRERGVQPDALLMITRTHSAEERMRAHLGAALGAAVAQAVCITPLHDFALNLLRAHSAHSDLPADAHIIDEASRVHLLSAALDIKEKAARRLLADISHCKRRRMPPPVGSALDQAFVTYGRHVRARGLVDFDDLLMRATQLLEDVPSVRAHTQRRFRHVLVDDCQAMDDGEYALLRLICGPTTQLCAMGDTGQALAVLSETPAVFQALQRDFPDADSVTWVRAHRFGDALLHCARALMLNHPTRTVLATQSQAHGDTELLRHSALSEATEADFVARSIAADAALYAPRDVAVLYRDVRQERILHDAMVRAGLLVQSRNEGRLAEDPAVQKVLWALQKYADDAGPLEERLHKAAVRLRASTLQRYRPLMQRALEALLPLARRFGADTEGFLRAVPQLTGIDTRDPQADAVSLLTLAASRGLEFRVVYLVGVEEGILPQGVGPWSRTALAAERQLVYLGLTRARERVVVSHARQRVWRGRVRRRRPSVFMNDVPSELWREIPMPPARRLPLAQPAARRAQLPLL